MVPVLTGSFRVVLGPCRNFPISHRPLLELSMQSRVLSRAFVRSLVLVGTFCAVHSSYGNILCGPGTLWDLSMQSQVLVGTFHVLSGPYENFPFGPASFWEPSVWSWVLMETFCGVPDPYENFPCGPESSPEFFVHVMGPYENYPWCPRFLREPFLRFQALCETFRPVQGA